MMTETKLHPVLYQVNTRPWTLRYATPGRETSLDDIPDSVLDDLAAKGVDWLYLLGVWQTGENGHQAALRQHHVYGEYRLALPDVSDEDICGSCFAITGYTVSSRLGGDVAMERFYRRVQARGMRLMLDFIPNHTAIDHPWAYQHPEYYIAGSEADFHREPANYVEVQTARGKRILAHGRDPYFPGWGDTLQLNYANDALQEAMIAELSRVAALCDGVRCDMAMLLLPGVVERTWGLTPRPFWPIAIERARRAHPGFVFMAEVYWGLEWTLQQQGFDYTYDKGLYDRLRDLHARPVHEHLQADLTYQNRLVRFLENHDEQRAASVFLHPMHPAAALITYLTPGLRFFHQGQFEGALERLPVQLCRAPEISIDEDVHQWYTWLLDLLKLPAFHGDQWRLLEALPEQDTDDPWENVIAWMWNQPGQDAYLVVVNYAPSPATCLLRLPFESLRGRQWGFEELRTEYRHFENGDTLILPGLHLDLPPWAGQVYRIY
jgi:glycosidase